MKGLLRLREELKQQINPKRAEVLQRFFKTGKGEYGEGDVFLGITVPQSRKIAIKFKSLKFADILNLLKSKIHEERLIALLILVYNFSHFAKASRDKQKQIFDFYLDNTKYINNWDLVDLSADKIVGGFLFARGPVGLHPRPTSSVSASWRIPAGARRGSPAPATPTLLVKLAKSKNIWERRIAIISTYQFIKNNKFDFTLGIAEILLQDKHDLIQKAVGWMLREVGKRDLQTEIGFLNKHYRKMPRTMLRYAIERFPEKLRLDFLKK